ncbi:hypothetical protein J3R30DRAFT_2101712 [Lentinula aciculospora]|uniref:Uncharacterized protein n=1 Tax=Lentinula aciculospora TaxID=153920 RepID=A0A9W9DQU3_9AGAR|nr:hypothetical protein J3R30DRAFT_2101712 [Lentinula aciculospora]
MYLCTSPSHFFVLLCLGTSFLAATASPLPVVGHNPGHPESSTSASKISSSDEYKVNVYVGIIDTDSKDEWSFLIFAELDLMLGAEIPGKHYGSSINKHTSKVDEKSTEKPFDGSKDNLIPRTQIYKNFWGQLQYGIDVLPLGSMVFESQAQGEDTIKSMPDRIKLPFAAAKKGGGFMDYILLVLEDMTKKGHDKSQGSMSTYRLMYEERYNQVSKEVFGVDLKP